MHTHMQIHKVTEKDREKEIVQRDLFDIVFDLLRPSYMYIGFAARIFVRFCCGLSGFHSNFTQAYRGVFASQKGS